MQDYIGHKLTEEFQGWCGKLPKDVRKRVFRKFEMLRQDPRHCSLCLKKVGTYWSIKISRGHRALAVKEGKVFVWVWVGRHDEYERRLR